MRLHRFFLEKELQTARLILVTVRFRSQPDLLLSSLELSRVTAGTSGKILDQPLGCIHPLQLLLIESLVLTLLTVVMDTNRSVQSGRLYIPDAIIKTSERIETMSQSSLLDDVTLEIHFSSVGFCRCERSRFRHDLKIALVTGAKLTVLHVKASPSTEWQDFPCVRDTLERWGAHPEG